MRHLKNEIIPVELDVEVYVAVVLFRYDGMCGSADSIGSWSGEPAAPEAGKWFDYQVKQLADNCAWA